MFDLPQPAACVAGTQTREVTLGDVVHNVTDSVKSAKAAGLERAVGLDHLDPLSTAVRRWDVVTESTNFTRVFREGHVLFGKRRAYQRKAAAVDFDGVCSGDLLVLAADGRSLLPELLPFLVHTDGLLAHAVQTSAGSLSPRTKWKNLASHVVLLPALDRQREISAILHSAEAALEKVEAAESACTRSLAACCAEWFAVEGRDPTVELSSLGTLQVGFPFKSARFAKEGVRLLRCSNVSIDALVWEDNATRFWPLDDQDDYADYQLSEGDLIVAMDRPFISTGFKVARVTASDLPALLLQRVGRFQTRVETDMNYVWAYLHSPTFKAQLRRSQQGTDLPHISRFDIESALLPLHHDHKRRHVGAEYRRLEILRRSARDNADSLRALRSVLIERYFG